MTNMTAAMNYQQWYISPIFLSMDLAVFLSFVSILCFAIQFSTLGGNIE
jgi:hypothetical protein